MPRAGYYPRKMAELREQFGGVCQAKGCERTTGLEFAHIQPTNVNGRGRGQAVRYHDIKKHPERFRLLCRPCHVAMDFDGYDQWAKHQKWAPGLNPQEEIPF